MTYRTLAPGSRVTHPDHPVVDVPPVTRTGAPDRSGGRSRRQVPRRLPYRSVLCGDSELAEGSIWEALDKAGTTSWTT